MRKIIIAGASSFIGMHLVQRLVQEKEYHITAVVRPKSKAMEKIRRISGEIRIIELELENYPLLYQYIDRDIDCFIPFTWAGTRKEERDNPQIQNTCMELMSSCVKNIIENCDLGCIITPGSVAEYGNGNKTHQENSLCCPDSMYGKGKLEFFNRTKEICQNRGIDYYHIRIFSIYGPDDYDRKIINTVVRKLLLNENFSMSSCEQQWNLLYIDDLIDLFLLLLHKEIPQGCYNVGSVENVSLRTYIERIEQSMGSEGKVFFGEKEKEHLKSADLACNIEKLISTGKWQPRVEFGDGIQKVIAYMSDRLNKADTMEGKNG